MKGIFVMENYFELILSFTALRRSGVQSTKLSASTELDMM